MLRNEGVTWRRQQVFRGIEMTDNLGHIVKELRGILCVFGPGQNSSPFVLMAATERTEATPHTSCLTLSARPWACGWVMS